MSNCECTCNRRKLFTFDDIEEFIASVESRISAQFEDVDIMDDLINNIQTKASEVFTQIENSTHTTVNNVEDKVFEMKTAFVDNVDSAQTGLFTFLQHGLRVLLFFVLLAIVQILVLRVLYHRLYG